MYDSSSGMSTRDWGPACWDFLFTSILGQFPVNVISHRDKKIQNEFRKMLNSLQFILPCTFCRKSFRKFMKELPVEEYLSGRLKLMYWLYLMKDKVNKKLLDQEKNGTIKTNFKTVNTPSFKQVLDKYEKFRAKCSAAQQTCSR